MITTPPNTLDKKKIICIGVTGGCADLINLIHEINIISSKFEIIGVVDDNFIKIGRLVFDIEILGDLKQLFEYRKDSSINYVTAIGNEKNFQTRKSNYKQPKYPAG
jgi:FlaA1/EpsC-like NDP-sugar epimerase